MNYVESARRVMANRNIGLDTLRRDRHTLALFFTRYFAVQ